MAEQNFDLFGEPVVVDELLRDKFMEPPFTILDTKTGSWQTRKRLWNGKGLKSELGRDAECMPSNFGSELDANGLDKYGRKPMSGTSIFDPALTELMYRWFCIPGGRIIDPFAGGSVRGIVANYIGFKYTGIELRREQVDANFENAKEIMAHDNLPHWICGDSEMIALQMAADGEMFTEKFDFLFTCPPYLDLEVYSDNPADLSTMNDTEFEGKFARIIHNASALMKDHTFAAIVVGDVRDKTGYYRDFTGMTKRVFAAGGYKLYNEAILLQPLGTAMLRAPKIFGSNKKLIKVHENVLIFYKGNIAEIQKKFNQ